MGAKINITKNEKIINCSSLVLSANFVSTEARADFKSALTEYEQEFGTNTYQNEPVTIEWFRVDRHEIDLNGDGMMDTYVEVDQFWAFGHCIWQSRNVRFTPIPGAH